MLISSMATWDRVEGGAPQIVGGEKSKNLDQKKEDPDFVTIKLVKNGK